MNLNCFKCGKENPTSDKVGFRESCFSCGQDLHCCKNCKFYDSSSYNECRETQADRVLDKEKANFCDYFQSGTGQTPNTSPIDEAKRKLEELFKKK